MNNDIVKYLAIGALGGSLLTGVAFSIKLKSQNHFISSSLSQKERDIQDFLKDFVELREKADLKSVEGGNFFASFFQQKELFLQYAHQLNEKRKKISSSVPFRHKLIHLVHARSIKNKENNQWEVIWEHQDFQGGKEIARGMKKSLIKVAFDPTFSYTYSQAKQDIELTKIHNPRGLHVIDYKVEKISP